MRRDCRLQGLSIFLWTEEFSFQKNDGSIRVVENGTLLAEPVGDIKVENIGDGGLLGLTLHPNFTQNHMFYVYYTYSNSTGLFNKVLMLKESNNRIIDSKTILDGIPGNDYRDGGRIKFGLDGKLYVSTGDASIPELSQDLNSLAGKILRINEDGTIPQDNPFSNSACMHMVLGMPKD